MNAGVRLALFVLCVVALAAVATFLVLLSYIGSDDGPRTTAEPAAAAAIEGAAPTPATAAGQRVDANEDLPPGQSPDSVLLADRTHATGAARRFLRVFLRYEVGDQSRSVLRRLAATTTPEWGRALVESPPRPLVAARFDRHAAVESIELTPLPANGGLAAMEAIATARRGGEQESLAFVLVLTGRRWLVNRFAP